MIWYQSGRIFVSGITWAESKTVWNILTDTTLWPSWGPSVTMVKCGQRHIGPSSTGRIKTSLGFWLPFTVTGYEDSCFWGWRVGGVQATGHTIVQEGEKCRIIFDMPWWAAPYALICLLAVGRITRLAEQKDS